MPAPDVFPVLKCCTKLVENIRLFDVKFFQYSTGLNDQMFAVAGERDIYICRPRLDADPPFEIVRWFQDENPDSSFNSLVWTKDPETRQPLLCVAGHVPKQIQILELEKGTPKRTLPGHGRGINDLAVSPLSTDLIFSASEDYTIRLWNIHPRYERQPCVAIFAGEGHRYPILAMHIHTDGRWLLSGGIDTAVCLWAIPSMEELEKTDEQLGNHAEPKVVYYPHFYSTEVHHNYVDCLQFYGDLIISRACRDQDDRVKLNDILLWKIEGFDADELPPNEPPIPTAEVQTRSSFPHSSQSRGFQRLLTFSIPHTDRFYHRFGLLDEPGTHPILCMGNQESKYFFWDLRKLEEGLDPGDEKKVKGRGKKRRKGIGSVVSENLKRLDDLRNTDSLGSEGGSTPMPSSTSNSAPPERKFQLGDPFLPLKPHATIVPKTTLSSHLHFATSQMAWSPDGTWLVGVGDNGIMCIFHRDKSVVNGVPRAGDGMASRP